MNDKKIYRVEARLDYFCNKKLNAYCKKTKLSKSELIRKLILDEEIREKPDDKFYENLRSLLLMSNDLKTIAEKAEYLNEIDSQKYNEVSNKFTDFITKIKARFI